MEDSLENLEMFQTDELEESTLADSVNEVSSFLDEELVPEEVDKEYSEEPEEELSTTEYVSHQPAPVKSGWNLLMFTVGAGIAVTGLIASALLLTGSNQSWIGTLSQVGATPGVLVLFGSVVGLFANLRQKQNRVFSNLNQLEADLQNEHQQNASSLEFLVEAQEQHLDRLPAKGEELEHVLHLLQRQDEKLSNLTKALKMYGQPLIELSKQLSQVDGQAKETHAKIEGTHAKVENVHATVEELGQNVQDKLNELAESKDSQDISEHIQEILLSTKIVDESLHKMQGELQESISGQLATDMNKILAALPKSEQDPQTAQMLTGLQQEMAGVSEMLNKLQHMQATAQPAPRPAAARPAAQPAARPAPAPQQAAPAASQPAAQPAAGGPGGLAQSISGAKKTKGKNVLGAIAKLKQMRP